MTHIEVLTRAFRALTAEQRANLLWHVNAGTPILCGDQSDVWTDGNGGG